MGGLDRDDIIRMAQDAGMTPISHASTADFICTRESIELFANLVAAAEREKLAEWMMARAYATGHGETIEDLLAELDWQIAENWNRAMINGIETEREACAKVCEAEGERVDASWVSCATAIRARGDL